MVHEENRKCPYCKEEVNPEAIKCRYCGSNIDLQSPNKRAESMHVSMLHSIEETVNSGRAVVSTDKSITIAIMQEALKHGRTATFYVPPDQAQAVLRWFWTPGRVKSIGMDPVSKEERKRIESELGVRDMGPAFSNRIDCACGGVYGLYEFVQHGLREHGRDWVGAVIEMKDTSVLRINPTQDAFCPRCHDILIVNHNYSMYSDTGKLIYGCCSSDTIVIA